MAHVFRCLISGIALLLFGGQAQAATTYSAVLAEHWQLCEDTGSAQYNYGSYTWIGADNVYFYSSVQLQCVYSYKFGTSTRTGTYNWNRTPCPNGGTFNLGTQTCTGAPDCPSGEERNYDTGMCEPPPPPTCDAPGMYSSDDGSCLCEEGYDVVPVDGQCVSNCTQGTPKRLFSLDQANEGCQGGCGYTRVGVPGGSTCGLHFQFYEGGQSAFECDYIGTGQNCTPGPQPEPPSSEEPPPPESYDPEEEPPQLPPSPCGPGTCGGTVNGQSVCLPCETVTNKTLSDITKTNPDGTTEQVIRETEDEVDENGLINRRTTTRTITRDANGDITSDTTEESEGSYNRSGFCEENPDAKICGEGTGFSAGCGEDFICDGDAVQCGIAREVHLGRCAVAVDDAVRDSGLQLLTEDGSMPSDMLESLSEEIEVDDLDASGFMGGGSCPADRSVTVGSTSFDIPFSTICPYLEMFGWLMIAIGGLLSIRILMGSA